MVDGRRLLRATMPQGGYQVPQCDRGRPRVVVGCVENSSVLLLQVVLKGTVDDQMGLQPASTPAVSVRDTKQKGTK